MSAWRNLTFGRPFADPDRVAAIVKDMGMYEIGDLIQNPDDRVAFGDGAWLDSISWTNRIKVPLARAFIMNPEVLILQRPLDHYVGTENFEPLLETIRSNVKMRGLHLEEDGPVNSRRPRTCFMSCSGLTAASEAEADELKEIVDTVITLTASENGGPSSVEMFADKDQI